MPGRGIQTPLLTATHILQNAQKQGRALQFMSLDIEKAFDRLAHTIIRQSLAAFGFPQLVIETIDRLALFGYAQVEVNGRKGIMFIIKNGSGQGDPLSSIIFVISIEPLLRILNEQLNNVFYKIDDTLIFGPAFYADDNLNALDIQSEQNLYLLLTIYDDYKLTSGLNINIEKSKVICINTNPMITELLKKMVSQ